MTFNEVLAALDALEGEVVSAVVSADRPGALPVMQADGVIRRMVAEEPTSRAAEEAVVFTIGGEDTAISLWPSGYLAATTDELNGLLIQTRDGTIRIYRNRRWID